MPSPHCFRIGPGSTTQKSCCTCCGVVDDSALSIETYSLCNECFTDYCTITDNIYLTSFIKYIQSLIGFHVGVREILKGLDHKVLRKIINYKTKLPTDHFPKKILVESFLHLIKIEEAQAQDLTPKKQETETVGSSSDIETLKSESLDFLQNQIALKCPFCNSLISHEACAAIKCDCTRISFFCGICEGPITEFPGYKEMTREEISSLMHRHVESHGYIDGPDGRKRLLQPNGKECMNGPFDHRMTGVIYGGARLSQLERKFIGIIKPSFSKITNALGNIAETIIKLDSNFIRSFSDLLYSLLEASVDESGNPLFHNPLVDIIKSENAKYGNLEGKYSQLEGKYSQLEKKHGDAVVLHTQQEHNLKTILKKIEEELGKQILHIVEHENTISSLEGVLASEHHIIKELEQKIRELSENAKEEGDVLLRKEIKDLKCREEIITKHQQTEFEKELKKLRDENAKLHAGVSVPIPEKKKPAVCYNFQRGLCPNQQCRYLHVKEDGSASSVSSDGSHIHPGSTKQQDRKTHHDRGKHKW